MKDEWVRSEERWVNADSLADEIRLAMVGASAITLDTAQALRRPMQNVYHVTVTAELVRDEPGKELL